MSPRAAIIGWFLSIASFYESSHHFRSAPFLSDCHRQRANIVLPGGPHPLWQKSTHFNRPANKDLLAMCHAAPIRKLPLFRRMMFLQHSRGRRGLCCCSSSLFMFSFHLLFTWRNAQNLLPLPPPSPPVAPPTLYSVEITFLPSTPPARLSLSLSLSTVKAAAAALSASATPLGNIAAATVSVGGGPRSRGPARAPAGRPPARPPALSVGPHTGNSSGSSAADAGWKPRRRKPKFCPFRSPNANDRDRRMLLLFSCFCF